MSARLLRSCNTLTNSGFRMHFFSLEDWQSALDNPWMLSDCADAPRILRSLPGIILLDRAPSCAAFAPEAPLSSFPTEPAPSDPLNARFSFALLTGGRSTRMGSDKAVLRLLGLSFEAHQLEKARMLGIEDILIGCGASVPMNQEERSAPPSFRYVPDMLPDRGPLGGLHACLSHVKRENCIVLGVDTPLVPPSALYEMTQAHIQSGAEATLAVHAGKYEPLIAIYRTALAERILPLIRDGGAPVRALLKTVRTHFWEGSFPEAVWHNCNTPESYRMLTEGP